MELKTEIKGKNYWNWAVALISLVVIFVQFDKWQTKKNVKRYEEDLQRDQRLIDEHAAKNKWKTEAVENCKSAFRARANSKTITFHTRIDVVNSSTRGNEEMVSLGSSRISPIYDPVVNETDSGYVYTIIVSDASTGGGSIDVLCYTNKQMQVVQFSALAR